MAFTGPAWPEFLIQFDRGFGTLSPPFKHKGRNDVNMPHTICNTACRRPSCGPSPVGVLRCGPLPGQALRDGCGWRDGLGLPGCWSWENAEGRQRQMSEICFLRGGIAGDAQMHILDGGPRSSRGMTRRSRSWPRTTVGAPI